MSLSASIVMPFRNSAATLDATLDSIATQSLGEFELVAVNDASTDRSEALIQARNDPRFRVLENPGRGLVDALNHGIEQARSDWIVRMDADDIMLPRRLEKQLTFAGQHPHLDLVASQVEIFPAADIQQGFREYQRWQNQVLTGPQIANNIYVESPFAHPSVMLRRSALLRLDAYQRGDFPEDYDLWLRMHQAGLGMQKIPEVLVRWRDSPKRLSRTDPVYRRAAFDRIRAQYLSRDPRLNRARPLVIWGAGRKTRRRVDELLVLGFKPAAWIDIDAKKIGNIVTGARVHNPRWLSGLDSKPFVLNYVTNHGAREDIASILDSMGYAESQDYLHVG